MAITRQCTTFVTNKVAQVIALGLLHTLTMVTNFSSIFCKWSIFLKLVTYFKNLCIFDLKVNVIYGNHISIINFSMEGSCPPSIQFH